MTDPIPWQADPRISSRPPGWVTTSGETWRDLDVDDARWLDRQWEDARGGRLPQATGLTFTVWAVVAG